MAFPVTPRGPIALPARLTAWLRHHQVAFSWVFTGAIYAQLILMAVDERITRVPRSILLAAHLLMVVVVIGYLIVVSGGRYRRRNVFTAGRGTGEFLAVVWVLAFGIGLSLFALDIGGLVAPIAVAGAIAVVGAAIYLADRRRLQREGPFAFTPPPVTTPPFGVQAMPQAAGWYADPWHGSQWRWWDGASWTAYVH